MDRSGSRGDDLESRLRALRSEPRREFAESIRHRLERRRSGQTQTGLRIALAGAVTAAFALAVALAGGTDATRSVADAVWAPAELVSQVTSGGGGSNATAGKTEDKGGGGGSATDDEYAPEKVAICHRTAADNNPYVLIVISVNAISAHINHPPQGNPPREDIIPAPATGCPGAKKPPK